MSNLHLYYSRDTSRLATTIAISDKLLVPRVTLYRDDQSGRNVALRAVGLLFLDELIGYERGGGRRESAMLDAQRRAVEMFVIFSFQVRLSLRGYWMAEEVREGGGRERKTD